MYMYEKIHIYSSPVQLNIFILIVKGSTRKSEFFYFEDF